MPTGSDIIASARSFLGTRWVHLGRLKGVAVDCIGLIILVAGETGCTSFAHLKDQIYGRTPDGWRLKRAFDEHMVLLWDESMGPLDLDRHQDGDVALIAWNRYPMHCGFLTRDRGQWYVIHALAQAMKVVEHTLDQHGRSKIKAVYRFKEV